VRKSGQQQKHERDDKPAHRYSPHFATCAGNSTTDPASVRRTRTLEDVINAAGHFRGTNRTRSGRKLDFFRRNWGVSALRRSSGGGISLTPK
jgi:hypothetical protein